MWITKGWRDIALQEFPIIILLTLIRFARFKSCFLWNISNHTNGWLPLDCDGYLPMNSAHPLKAGDIALQEFPIIILLTLIRFARFKSCFLWNI